MEPFRLGICLSIETDMDTDSDVTPTLIESDCLSTLIDSDSDSISDVRS
jgi:hypothetical protein